MSRFFNPVCCTSQNNPRESKPKTLEPFYMLLKHHTSLFQSTVAKTVPVRQDLKVNKQLTWVVDTSHIMTVSYDEKSIKLVDWSARLLCSGFPFQQTSTEHRVEVACPKAAHTQRSMTVSYPSYRRLLSHCQRRLQKQAGQCTI